VKLQARIKATVIAIIIFSNMLIVSGIQYANKTELNKTVNKLSLLYDNYEKYSGDKIQLNEQQISISGLFGNLEITPFILEPSTNFLLNQINYNEEINVFKSSSQWVFENTTLSEIRSLFLSAGIDSDTCNELIENTSETVNSKEYVTTPNDSFFWSLSAAIKAKLYPLIGEYSENVMYSYPLYFCSDNAKEWFYKSTLNEAIKEKILSLVYKKSGVCYLSDIHLILPYLRSIDERIEFLKDVYRSKSMDVKLVIKEDQNVSSIAKYWGVLGRTSYIEPLLQNLSSHTGGGKINIENLLPAIPQDRLNTFCGYDEYQTDWKDCHWTTINFFNSKVDERYYNLPDLLPFIKEFSSELKIDSQLKFGDIICIFNKNNDLVHSCTYIADNLTLTKNGMGNLKPFILSNLDKTVSLYGEKTAYLTRTTADTFSVK
jgi:hypothetical protein